jgi:hypothetical protein
MYVIIGLEEDFELVDAFLNTTAAIGNDTRIFEIYRDFI